MHVCLCIQAAHSNDPSLPHDRFTSENFTKNTEMRGIHSYIYSHAILEITSKVTSQKTMSSLKLEHPIEGTPQQGHFF